MGTVNFDPTVSKWGMLISQKTSMPKGEGFGYTEPSANIGGLQGVNGINVGAVDGGRFATGSAEAAVSKVSYESDPAFLATASSGSYYTNGEGHFRFGFNRLA